MKFRALLVLLLLATMVPLTPMAYASPPDPSWVPGYFDDADFDDVVIFLTSACGALDLFPLDNLGQFLVLITSVEPQPDGHVTVRPVTPTEARAPPAS